MTLLNPRLAESKAFNDVCLANRSICLQAGTGSLYVVDLRVMAAACCTNSALELSL